MKKSIRYKTKLKYVEYVEICVLSSQQTSLKYFVSLEVFFPKLSKPIFFSDFNGNDETNKIALWVDNVHWDFLKKILPLLLSWRRRARGGGGGAFRFVTRRKELRSRLG